MRRLARISAFSAYTRSAVGTSEASDAVLGAERSARQTKGSLVVELPSRHEGGALVVEHRGEKKVFRGASRRASDLSLLAFYADCHHEVKPVDSGYRITLTYHLLFRGAPGDRAPLPLSAALRLTAGVSRAALSTI
jgi:predicted 2-oxoglutarate/Fe(II)-dependent dioxygenase YbiX